MNVLILAAGFGTRMYPLTKNTPKALLKVKEKPIIEHLLKQLDNIEEIEKVYILSNNKFYINFLEWLNNFKKKERISEKIKLINNGIKNEDEKRGALGDLGFTFSIISDKKDFLIFASDDIFELNFNEFLNFSKQKNSSIVALKIIDKERIKNFSCVLVDSDNKITYFEEKPINPVSNICATACYYIVKEDIETLKKAIEKEENKDKLGYIVKLLMENSKIYGRLFDGLWSDVESLLNRTIN